MEKKEKGERFMMDYKLTEQQKRNIFATEAEKTAEEYALSHYFYNTDDEDWPRNPVGTLEKGTLQEDDAHKLHPYEIFDCYPPRVILSMVEDTKSTTLINMMETYDASMCRIKNLENGKSEAVNRPTVPQASKEDMERWFQWSSKDGNKED